MSKRGFNGGFSKYLSERKTRKLDEADMLGSWRVLGMELPNNEWNKFSCFLGENTLIDIEGEVFTFASNNATEEHMRESFRQLIDEASHLYLLEDSSNTILSNGDREAFVDSYIGEVVELKEEIEGDKYMKGLGISHIFDKAIEEADEILTYIDDPDLYTRR